MALHTSESLPAYRLICIDEGQDLHSADYALIHTLYPRANLNVFGDKVQALHEACGISDWQTETGISTIYELKSNYRNTPAIVDFCNRKFNGTMEYVGNITDVQKPRIINNMADLQNAIKAQDVVTIVKNRKQFETLCSKLNMSESQFNYIDTKADTVRSGRIACYSVFAAKGLEFPSVLVYADDMTINQKVVACTRAMERLYYYE